MNTYSDVHPIPVILAFHLSLTSPKPPQNRLFYAFAGHRRPIYRLRAQNQKNARIQALVLERLVFTLPFLVGGCVRTTFAQTVVRTHPYCPVAFTASLSAVYETAILHSLVYTCSQASRLLM